MKPSAHFHQIGSFSLDMDNLILNMLMFLLLTVTFQVFMRQKKTGKQDYKSRQEMLNLSLVLPKNIINFSENYK